MKTDSKFEFFFESSREVPNKYEELPIQYNSVQSSNIMSYCTTHNTSINPFFYGTYLAATKASEPSE